MRLQTEFANMRPQLFNDINYLFKVDGISYMPGHKKGLQSKRRKQQIDIPRELEMQVGVLNADGIIEWFDWRKLADYLPAGLCKVLSKGKKYRVGNRKHVNRRALNIKIFKQLFPNKQLSNKQSIQSRMRNKIFTSFDVAIQSSDVANRLASLGWVIRPEDKGNRMVLCSTEWEEKQLNMILHCISPISKEQITKASTTHINDEIVEHQPPVLYFLPKTHKQSETINGRPILSWPKERQPYANSIKQELSTYLNCIDSCNYKSVDLAISSMKACNGKEYKYISGDIHQMYTSIPRDILIRELENHKVPKHIIDAIQKHLSRTVFTFRDHAYAFTDGVGMGSTISNQLAIFTVSCMLQPVISKYKDIAEFASVVDDFLIRIEISNNENNQYEINRLIEIIKNDIENAIQPLKMVWNNEPKFMDCLLSCDGRHDKFIFRGKSITSVANNKRPFQNRLSAIIRQMRRIMIRELPVERQGDTFKYKLSSANLDWMKHNPITDSTVNNDVLLFLNMQHIGEKQSNCELCKIIATVVRRGDIHVYTKANKKHKMYFPVTWYPKIQRKINMHLLSPLHSSRTIIQDEIQIQIRVQLTTPTMPIMQLIVKKI